MNPFGLTETDAREAAAIVGRFWQALARSDSRGLRKLVPADAPDLAAMLRGLHLTPMAAMHTGTLSEARVLADGSLMFRTVPTLDRGVKIVGREGTEPLIGYNLRLTKAGGAWRIVGVNDGGDRETIDVIAFAGPG